MENVEHKASFLKNEFVKTLSSINPEMKGLWGKMNVQQMVEHMSFSFRQANGKDKYSLLTPEENVAKAQAFLMTDKPFRENTPNAIIGENTIPEKNASIADALNELQTEINDFFALFDAQPDAVITNPFFGDLNYEMWVQLLHKHSLHHLRQFGITTNP
ncbi:hypothetical protein CAP35_14435 [Chitinophagaceae bacterium IBVUCB1]|nr:hypothetical protein CAP35_14435 [Chitinophagaceae bacterium IBVUCB1]